MCPPASVIVLSQPQIVALAVHPHRDVPDPGPRIQPGAECVEGADIRRHGAPSESDSSTQERAAWVEHALLENLVCPLEQRLWDREAERLRGLEIDHQFELCRLLHSEV